MTDTPHHHVASRELPMTDELLRRLRESGL